MRLFNESSACGQLYSIRNVPLEAISEDRYRDSNAVCLYGGVDRAVIGDPVCLQVEAIALIDATFGDGRAAIGSGDGPVRACDSRSSRSSGMCGLRREGWLKDCHFRIWDGFGAGYAVCNKGMENELGWSVVTA